MSAGRDVVARRRRRRRRENGVEHGGGDMKHPTYRPFDSHRGYCSDKQDSLHVVTDISVKKTNLIHAVRHTYNPSF